MHHAEKNTSYWLRVSIRTHPALVDALGDYLVGVIGAGVEVLVDDQASCTMINAFLEKRNPDPSLRKKIVAQITDYVHELAGIFQVPAPDMSCSVIHEEDWGSTWKKHFHPFAIVPGLVIKPTWEQYHPQVGEKVIEMDPGMAFGTGHHATTTLSLELLKAELAKKTAAMVLDVGTGTGILGMAAALFGADCVWGIDNDPDAVAAASENVRRNGLEGKIMISATPLSALREKFSIVVANIIHDVLVEMAGELVRLTATGGSLILSGILRGEQTESIIKRFTCDGMALETHLQREEWSALLFEKNR